MNTTSNVDIKKSYSSKGVFPARMAFTLLLPFRNAILSPNKLIQQLELEEHHRVLELGPGPGFFSLPVAKKLINGQLVVADIQQEMLGYTQRRANKRGYSNLKYYLCDGNSFNLSSNSFDRIFMVSVLGEVENQHKYLDEMYRMLKPGGIISVAEMIGDPDKMSLEQVKAILDQHGFTFDRLYGNRRNYTINFRK